jgi:hemerythrin
VSQPFEWQSDYAMGDPEIDAQHRMLFDLANRILTIMDPHQGFGELKAAIQALLDYIQVHFEAEEERMREWGYPELEHHQALHAAIRRDISRLIQESKDLTSLKKDLNFLMTQWVLVHIRKEDCKIGEFCRSQSQNP